MGLGIGGREWVGQDGCERVSECGWVWAGGRVCVCVLLCACSGKGVVVVPLGGWGTFCTHMLPGGDKYCGRTDVHLSVDGGSVRMRAPIHT